ncbi:hypothetical protein C8R44DRAFT_741619 [Mycena epipterygia]|nr:hypothetical protein C8R44DRAFT_741619 [Mycena epipterygia]
MCTVCDEYRKGLRHCVKQRKLHQTSHEQGWNNGDAFEQKYGAMGVGNRGAPHASSVNPGWHGVRRHPRAPFVSEDWRDMSEVAKRSRTVETNCEEDSEYVMMILLPTGTLASWDTGSVRESRSEDESTRRTLYCVQSTRACIGGIEGAHARPQEGLDGVVGEPESRETAVPLSAARAQRVRVQAWPHTSPTSQLRRVAEVLLRTCARPSRGMHEGGAGSTTICNGAGSAAPRFSGLQKVLHPRIACAKMCKYCGVRKKRRDVIRTTRAMRWKDCPTILLPIMQSQMIISNLRLSLYRAARASQSPCGTSLVRTSARRARGGRARLGVCENMDWMSRETSAQMHGDPFADVTGGAGEEGNNNEGEDGSRKNSGIVIILHHATSRSLCAP